MAAAASAGSANPRYLEHGWKRVMGWRLGHDKGNQTLEDFFLGNGDLICGDFWVHRVRCTLRLREVSHDPLGAVGDVLDPTKGGVSVSPTALMRGNRN